MTRGIRIEVVVAVLIGSLLPFGSCQDATYKGCYIDGNGETSPRVMRDLVECDEPNGVCQESCGPEQRYCESATAMTINVCRDLCRTTNFQYYGLEGGNQCFCGGAFARPFTNGNTLDGMLLNCSDPCTGDSSQTCGGGEFRIKIYEFEDPIENPGCFFPGAVPHSTVKDVGVGIGETLTFTCEPGFELIGEPDITCIANRTWSSDQLPICNHTGIFPETTTEPPTTTTAAPPTTTTAAPPTTTTAAPPTTTTAAPPTEEPSTENPTTTQRDVTTNPSTTSFVVKPEPTTMKPNPRTTVEVVPTKPRTDIMDYLPYIIGGAAALLLLLVIIIVCALTCKLRKRSGNANQDISLKPENLAPVTLLNRGFNPGEDPEAATPDILLDSEFRPPVVENEYANSERPREQKMTTFSRETDGASKGDDPILKDPNTAYEEMKPVSPTELKPMDGIPFEGGEQDPRKSNYEDMSDSRMGSQENLIAEDSTFHRNPSSLLATKL